MRKTNTGGLGNGPIITILFEESQPFFQPEVRPIIVETYSASYDGGMRAAEAFLIYVYICIV